MPSLAARIRALNDGTRSTRAIADAVGCDTPYVRVVLRQRTATGNDSKFDNAYLKRAHSTRSLRKAWRLKQADYRASRRVPGGVAA